MASLKNHHSRAHYKKRNGMGAEVKGEKGIRTRGKKEEEPKIRE